METTGFSHVITEIENALVDRLRRGLGKLAVTVRSYGGEFNDDSIGTNRLPLVMVTYGGANVKRMNVRASRYQSTATFAIMVVTQSLRSNLAGRAGGVDSREIGAYQLITAVRRLLDSQTLGQMVQPLEPVRVRTLFNNQQVKNQRLTAYSVEYDVIFDDLSPLEDGRFPEVTQDRSSPDYIFNQYKGELSEPYPYLEQVLGNIYDPTTGASVPYTVETQEQT